MKSRKAMSARMVYEVGPADSPLQLERVLNHLDEQVLKVESEGRTEWCHREGPFNVFFSRGPTGSPEDMDRTSPADQLDGSRGPGADFTVWEELEHLAEHPTEIDFFSQGLLGSDTFEIVSSPNGDVNCASAASDAHSLLCDREFAI